MNRNSLIFVLASLSILVGWQYFYERLYPTQPLPAAHAALTSGVTPAPQTAVADTAAAKPAVLAGQASSAPAQHAQLRTAPEKKVSVETDKYQVELSSWGARFIQLKLKEVTHKGNDGVETPLDLISSQDDPVYGSLEIPGFDLTQSWQLLTPKPQRSGDDQFVTFSLQPKGSPLELRKTFRFPKATRHFGVTVQLINHGKQPWSLGPVALLWGPNIGGEHSGMGRFPPGGVVQMDGKIERENAAKDAGSQSYSAPRWVALKNQYFVQAYFPAAGSAWTKAEIRQLGDKRVVTALTAEGISLQPGQTMDLTTDAYAGPQEYDQLKAEGKNFQAVVQFQYYKIFDWLNPLCIVLLHMMKWFQRITGNWGVAIILITLVVRGLMFWPSLKSMVSMRRMQTKMAAMQPRLETLKKVYKDDSTKLNAEMMKLYKEYGVNPMGGCLPMLLQVPVFFALYGTLDAAFELRGAPFIWHWTDLTAGDPTYIFPIAMGVSMFLQQKLAPASATVSEEQQQMQKMMLWIMPIMFGGMAVFMKWPVGLLLYWTASNLFGVVQQLAVNKAVD